MKCEGDAAANHFELDVIQFDDFFDLFDNFDDLVHGFPSRSVSRKTLVSKKP